MKLFPTRKKIDFFRLFLYLLFSLASLCLYFVGNNGEPFPIALTYALLSANTPPIICAVIYILPSLFSSNILLIILYIVQAFLLLCGFFLQRKIHQSIFAKANVISMLALSFSLGIFVAFAPLDSYPIPLTAFANSTLAQKMLFAIVIFLLSATFSVAIKALLNKLLKCRLRNEEIIFSVLFLTLTGVGLCHFLSVNAYMGAAFFILFVFSYVTKDNSVLLCAFLLSLPPAITAGISLERFFVYGIVLALFHKTGRLASACAVLIVFFTYGYFDSLYAYETPFLVQSLLSVILPTLLFVMTPTPLLRSLENKLIFYREKHLTRIAINRNRAAIGEKLFEISAVFREIESTFSALSNTDAEQNAKEFIRTSVLEDICKRCEQYPICKQNNIPMELDKLIDVGCLKGRVNLIDIPKQLANACYAQSEILSAINHQLIDYKKFMLEAENAACGRMLLAGQAQGISQILKNIALEQSEPLRIYTDKERALNVALLGAGIVCSEVLIYGDEENLTVSLICLGRSDVKRISAIVSNLFDRNMLISERIALSQDKYCCILRKAPYFDAAFGVATTKKKGQTASGDTHSVIKIDERRFMVALSDGMGSGEYAQRISESTISLLESFYRAKMPSDLVLSTINKLLTFNKEETFACVDIAVINLDDGYADIVKIGSPCGFILSDNLVKVLEGTSLPLGILDLIRPDTATYQLSNNDVLLFLSDGITDAFGSITDLCDVLKRLPCNNPQQLVDGLLANALETYGGEPKDDMTAIAVRLFQNTTS